MYAYPNEYSVGITSLGYQLVWAFLETHPQIAVSRLFTDVSDVLPNRPNLLGFSVAWELDYSNLMDLLETVGVPLLADDRGDDDPIVFGGGPVLTGNPEPLADFFDVVLLGDGEDLLQAFAEQMLELTKDGMQDRKEILAALASIPGVYVPSFYRPTYESATGALIDVQPIHPAAPPVVQKQTYRGNTLASSTVVTPRAAWESIFMTEVVRSCPEMCRFCMASYLTLPFRVAPLEGSLFPLIEKGLAVTDRLGLLGASVTQHPEFNDLLDWVLKPERAHVRLSIASVRTNTVTERLAATLTARGTKSLTVAVESGSERIRHVINKKLKTDEIMAAAVAAQAGGLVGGLVVVSSST